MRFKEFNIINEVNMSTGALKKMSSGINAIAGLELEVVTEKYKYDNNFKSPYYAGDGYIMIGDASHWNLAKRYLNRANSDSVIDKFIDKVNEDYEKWKVKKTNEIKDEHDKLRNSELLRMYYAEHNDIKIIKQVLLIMWENGYLPTSLFSNNSLTSNEFLENLTDEKVRQAVHYAQYSFYNVFDGLKARVANTVASEWFDSLEQSEKENVEKKMSQDFLSDEIKSLTYRSFLEETCDRAVLSYIYRQYIDFAEKINLHWPEMTMHTAKIYKDLASSLATALGTSNVVFSDDYHGTKNNRAVDKTMYAIEADGSISPDEEGDIGFELITPPMPLEQLISKFHKILDWLKKNQCYTNHSTGLHINVSLPNLHTIDIDYVKLALLSGDQYVLDLFNRNGNQYAINFLNKIKISIENMLPSEIQTMTDKFKKGLNKIANNAITLPLNLDTSNRYLSINIRHSKNYIEFRSPGGDWSSTNIETLINIIRRYVIAMDAAGDPEKFKYEYFKKLYSLIHQTRASPVEKDITLLFSRYSAGYIDKQTLIATLQRLRTEVLTNRPKDLP